MNFLKLIKKNMIIAVAMGISSSVAAQEDEGLVIGGSVDTYYTYDFSGSQNIGNSFAGGVGGSNAVSLGMIDLTMSHSVGKASFFGEVSFGGRSTESIGSLVGIQNLYMTYAFSESFSMTAGYMGTFVGYEVIAPTGNFNYSTSYLFTNGPFQNAGIKANYNFSDKLDVMVGLFNDWNVYGAEGDTDGVSDLGIQVYFAPVDGWDVYLNTVISGQSETASNGTDGTIFDITTGYQITENFYLGLNAADRTYADSDLGGYSGVAIYPQLALGDIFNLGFRLESYKTKEVKAVTDSYSILSNTLTGKFALDQMTFLAEFRLDSDSDEVGGFVDADGATASSASQISLAAVYSF